MGGGPTLTIKALQTEPAKSLLVPLDGLGGGGTDNKSWSSG